MSCGDTFSTKVSSFLNNVYLHRQVPETKPYRLANLQVLLDFVNIVGIFMTIDQKMEKFNNFTIRHTCRLSSIFNTELG